MNRFEYIVVRKSMRDSDALTEADFQNLLEVRLGQYGEIGYELVAIDADYYYFKREVQEQSQ